MMWLHWRKRIAELCSRPWLATLSRRGGRKAQRLPAFARPRHRRCVIESLEELVPLAVTDSFVAGHLVFTGSPASETLTIQITSAAGNNVQYDLGGGPIVRNGVVDIVFNGLGGNDTLNLSGSAAAESVTATIGASDLVTWGVTPITVNGATTLAIDTAGGNDTVSMNLNAIALSTATASSGSATITGSGRSIEVDGANQLYATVATLTQLNLDDTSASDVFFYNQPPLSGSVSTGIYGADYVTSFSGALPTHVAVHATHGGTDTAIVQGSAGNDSLAAFASYISFNSGGRDVIAAGFDATYTYAAPGGTDIAQLLGTTGVDNYYRSAAYQILYGTGYANWVTGFAQNYAFSNDLVNILAGVFGHDVATFDGSPTTEVFYALPSYCVLQGPGGTPIDETVGFRTNHYNGGGGADVVVFYDSPRDDQLVATPQLATITGPGFTTSAANVRRTVSVGFAGGADTATLYDSAGNDSFLGSPTNSVLQDSAGASYLNQVIEFDNVQAIASTGGDSAALYDSLDNDSIAVGGNTATLYSSVSTLSATGFDGVFGIRSTGVDDESIQPAAFGYAKNAGWVGSATQSQLTPGEVNQLLRRGAAASASNDAIIAIVDRNGIILGVRVESGINESYYDHSLYGSLQEYLNFAIDGAVAKARTAAFFSSNAAPLTSRTVRFISQSTILEREVDANPNITDVNSTRRGPGFVAPIGVGGHFPPEVQFTPLVDLFNIEHTNRDSRFSPGTDRTAGTGDDIELNTRFNVDPTYVPMGQSLTAPVAYGAASGLNPRAQSRGIATLPGGIPLYKNGELVGAVGVFFPGSKGYASYEQGFVAGVGQTEAARTNASRVLESEWIAFAAAGGSPVTNMAVGALGSVLNIPGIVTVNGRLDLVGITLETIGPGNPLNGGPNTVFAVGRSVGVGNPDSGVNQRVNTAGLTAIPGKAVPFGWLVNPHNSSDNTITAADVTQIVNNGVAEANKTRAAIRLPLSSTARMIFTVTDTRGNVLGQYRMPDATYFSIDVSTAKARNVAYYNDASQLQDIDKLPAANVPKGAAFTARTFRYLVAPRFPTGGGNGTPPGPFSILNTPGVNSATAENIGAPLPASAFDSTVGGYDAFRPGTNFRDPGDADVGTKNQNGIVFFPGSSGIYKTIGGSRVLVGGFGVSGDGVDQDDVVTVGGQNNFEPLNAQRIDADPYLFTYRTASNVRLPYQKFNRNPQLV